MVVAGFEPLDILAGLVQLVELIRDGEPEVRNAFPRCVTREGNRRAQEQLWSVFRPMGGRWRGIAHVPNGNLRLRDEWAQRDARRRFDIDLATLWDCGALGAGAALHLRRHHGRHRVAAPTARCSARSATPEQPVGACMVSSRGHLPHLAPVRRASRICEVSGMMLRPFLGRESRA